MMKRILVPTDFSDCAKRAARTAIEIAKLSGGEIHFLHFMAIPIDWSSLERGEERLYPDISREVEDTKAQLQELVEMAKNESVTADFSIGFNEGTTNIIDHITDQNSYLIVMGSHGASGIRELFIGSNAQKVVRLSPVPVLIVKDTMTDIHIPDIIFVSDFETEVIKSFESLLSFAELIGSKIHLVYINTPSYFNDTWEVKEKMEPFIFMGGELIGKIDILNTYVFEEGLERYSQDFDKAIVAMATHGRRGVSRVFYGSVTEKVVNHIPFPVLSLKIEEEVGELYVESFV
jgi:nucleotide-binding universal stress UspA family protein